MAQLLQNESESDYDEGKDIAEWKRICEEQGIDVTSGEGEPAGPSEVDEDPDDAPQITNMWVQMKVLHQLLKHQRQELKEKCTMSTEILGRHKNFMELVKSLDEDMQVYQHAEAQQEPPQQPAIVQGQQHPQPTTLKGGSDPWKPIYQLTHGHVRYKCPQCEHTKMSKGQSSHTFAMYMTLYPSHALHVAFLRVTAHLCEITNYGTKKGQVVHIGK